ncbi:ketopantoate reductase family protein [Hymenobacter volaticus]|uniref:2-dehydropantoate 2-reductase n=1 Tax=Hymenobacter volaticus TaxID=2932254 RepID=A0ABY4G279_9BACT|nr:2-dehydropantoate 2-reductase [Hymenobacter volaticus]UOQ64980.1 2-dehydropantoate 2-reductase [Hymenobacter volaticus]
MKTTELAIVGLGGVGGYFGFKLAQVYAPDPSVSITFVARGATYNVVKEHGLTLLSPEHPNSTTQPTKLLETVAELADIDVVIICVKEYDLEKVCTALKPKLHDNAVLLPLMNGVDIYDRIRRIIPAAIVLPACVYVASHIKEKGVVEHKGNPGRIIVGQDPQRPDYQPQPLVELLAKAGIAIEYQQDAFPAIWTKFFFIASFGLVSARYNKSIGQVEEEPALHERAQAIMQEIEAIAHKKGVALPADIINQTFQKARSFPYQTPTSLQLDVNSSKAQTELELFAGAILTYGEALGVEVKETRRIYEEIKESQRQKISS